MQVTNLATNEVIIEGLLQEMDLRDSQLQKNGANRDYVAGTVTVRVTQKVGATEETSEVPISVFATKLKNDGNPNPAYKNIDEMRRNFVSLAAGGANADCIRISRGELNENTFVSEGRTITGFRIRNSFFNRAVTDIQHIAAFKNKIVLLSIEPEIDREGNQTNRLKIVGALVVYGPRADVLTYYVEDPTAIAYISKNWQEGDTVNVSGRLRFTVETGSRDVEPVSVGFGEALPETYTRTVRELIITSGSAGGLDEDEAYDHDAITNLLAERKVRISQMASKESTKASTPAAAQGGKKAFDGGF